MKEELYEQIYNIENTHWWYVARREIIFDLFTNFVNLNANDLFLDIGCGTGMNLEHLNQMGYSSAIGLDLSTKALDFCKLRHLANLICADGIMTPFADESFDNIFALDLLEHIKKDKQAMSEFSRLLKPGGKIVIFVPAFNFLWGIQDEVGQHYRRYNLSELRRIIFHSSLKIVKLTYVNTLLFPLIWFGRTAIRALGDKSTIASENDLSPGWINTLLLNIFISERRIINKINFPIGVSIFCIAQK